MARKASGVSKKKRGLPDDVADMLAGLESFLDAVDPENGLKPARARYGVYAFFDYDGEPIYCGQTAEQLGVRIRRHLTNQRTDAVAMRVLDPLEVAEVEVWPLWEFENAVGEQARLAAHHLNAAEYTLYRKLIEESKLHRILNEKIPAELPFVDLPRSYRGAIVTAELRARLGHPDLRIARRAQKISELAGIISQRNVSVGLRNTLVTQAERLLSLSAQRFIEIAGQNPTKSTQEMTESETETEV